MFKDQKRRLGLQEKKNKFKTFGTKYVAKHTKPKDLFPTFTPWIIFCFAMVSRLWLVTKKDNWWILHPDEVFQSLEVAHSEVYGYGFRPYEFLPEPKITNSSSIAERQEAMLGMYSMRSFMVPRFFMLIFHLNRITGLDINPFLLGKISHGVISSSLSLCVHRFTKALSNSNDVANIAAILVSCSVHITVLGSHTLINSLLAPLVFLTLSYFIETVNNINKENKISYDSKEFDQNMNSENGDAVHVPHGPQKGENAKTGIKVNALLSKEMRKYAFLHVICGIAMALLIYSRQDLILIFGSITVTWLFPLNNNVLEKTKFLLYMSVGFVLAIIWGGYDDYCSYGTWFVSVSQWFQFNVYKDLSSKLFGLQSSSLYFTEVIVANFYTLLLAGNFFLVHLVMLFKPIETRQSHKKFPSTVAVTAILFTIYSLKGHKEVRFIHNVIVLTNILYGWSVIILYRFLTIQYHKRKELYKFGVYILCFLGYVNLAIHHPSPEDRSNASWTYAGAWNSNEVNRCLYFISQQPDVTGVYSDASIHLTGAYTILHKDVPIFPLIHYEYTEFSLASRVILNSSSWLFSSNSTVSVAVVMRVTDFVDVANQSFMKKILLQNPTYNYLLLQNRNIFAPVGYEAVYQTKAIKVLKRNVQEKHLHAFQKYLNGLNIINNATILQYEASWLNTLGLHEKCIERAQRALNVGDVCIKCYQLIYSAMYIHLDKRKIANEYIQQCIDKYGAATCQRPQPRIILHTDYDLDITL